MTLYDQAKLYQYRDGILGIFIEKLEELKQGQIPLMFNTFAEIFRATIQYFPQEIQQQYKDILSTALMEHKFLEASALVNALKNNQQQRLQSIEDFLKKIDEE